MTRFSKNHSMYCDRGQAEDAKLILRELELGGFAVTTARDHCAGCECLGKKERDFVRFHLPHFDGNALQLCVSSIVTRLLFRLGAIGEDTR